MTDKIKLPSIKELTTLNNIKLPPINQPSNYPFTSPNSYKCRVVAGPPGAITDSMTPPTTTGTSIAPVMATTPSLTPITSHSPNFAQGSYKLGSPDQPLTVPPSPNSPPSYNRFYPYHPNYLPYHYNNHNTNNNINHNNCYYITTMANHYIVPEIVNKSMNKCQRCGTTETPEWRRGPNGVRTLCNACGLFHAKLVKRKGVVKAAQEVLHNKVRKGKNGRRIVVKDQQNMPQVSPLPQVSPISQPVSQPVPLPLVHQVPQVSQVPPVQNIAHYPPTKLHFV